MSLYNLDSSVLDVLVCPITKQSLSIAKEEVEKAINIMLLNSVNESSNKLTYRPEECSAYLVTQDMSIAYPVVEDLPYLVEDASIELNFNK